MLTAALHRPPTASSTLAARWIARAAIESLYTELILAPKPGLVSPGDNGSHRDMNAATLIRSLFSLRHYFHAIAIAAYRDGSFAELQRLGVAAEVRMLRATGGINAHRGAIFNLGLLAAAAAHRLAAVEPLTADGLSAIVRDRWSADICAMQPTEPSHGLLMATRYGAGGARLEAAQGYPAVFSLALPTLRNALDSGLGRRRALVEALFALIAHVTDTNLLYRGGAEGLAYARNAARQFLWAGGTRRRDWEERARTIRDTFVARNLSPGGAADLLAATWFVHTITANR
jgi:triphosphoribosyl-dephospho-CoA synthase